MNGRTARRLRAIAYNINPGGTGTLKQTGTKIIRIRPGPGMPGIDIPVTRTTTRRTGTRMSYQRLKRQLNETPRPMRGELLEALESYQS